MKLVDALTVTLREWNVRYVFGVSGANVEHLHDAIYRLGEGRLQSVLAKSEVGAAFMADARARIHRTLGVCCATSGGGMMNLAVGIAESFAESVPLLALVGQVPTALEGRGGFQDSSGIGRSVDAEGMFRAIAKYVARVEAGSFWEQLAAAARAAMSGRQGPAVLLLPRDVYEQDVAPMPGWFPAALAELASPKAAAPESIRALLEALRASRRPVIIAGTGVSRSSDRGALVSFALAAQIPVVTTMGDPAAFPNDDALWLGMIGAAGHPSAHRYLDERADLIVAVGTGLNAMTRQPVAGAFERCRVAAVNIDLGEISRTVNPSILVEGDAGQVFRALEAVWTETPFERAPAGPYALTRYRPKLAEPEVGDRARPRDALLQSEALSMLEPHLPEDGHVLFDAGNCAAAALHYVSMPPEVTSTIALGMGGMGYAIAGAVGAQLGSERTRTVVFCGDGAFLMTGLEVHTATALGLPILFVVFNNQKHGMCVTRQKLYFEGRVDCAEYAGVDIATIARGLGGPDRLWVGRASTRSELCDGLTEYASLPPRTGVLELNLAVEEVPPFAPFLRGSELETYVVRTLSSGRLRSSERTAA